MIQWYDHFQIVCLILLLLLVAGRATHLRLVHHINPVRVGGGKTTFLERLLKSVWCPEWSFGSVTCSSSRFILKKGSFPHSRTSSCLIRNFYSSLAQHSSSAAC